MFTGKIIVAFIFVVACKASEDPKLAPPDATPMGEHHPLEVAYVEAPQPETKPVQIDAETARERMSMFVAPARRKTDVANVVATEYDATIIPKRRADPSLVDMLTRPLDPGEHQTVGVNFYEKDFGARLVISRGKPWVQWEGEPLSVDEPACTDKPEENLTWCEVTVTNNTAEARRAIFFLRYHVN